MTESAVPSLNMSALLGAPETNPVPKTALETVLATVEPDDAAATKMEQVKFQFRDLLDEKQKADLKAAAPAVTERMINNYNEIIQFGEPVLTKLNNTSVQLLETQKQIKVPAADLIVNDLLREIDGYSAKYRNEKLENGVDKVFGFLKGIGYSLKTLVRESQPIVDKLDMAEMQLKKMELNLADNVSRGQTLHKNTTEILTDVVAVLATLEEILETATTRFNKIDTKVKEAEKFENEGTPVVTLEFEGKTISLNDLRNQHTVYANGISEIEKTWFDWRQQFFLGYSTAPSVLNLILVSATMQRRCQSFRTMGLPAARRAIAMWQQAVVAEKGAKMGTTVGEGTNKLLQAAAEATGQAVATTAMAAQTPIVSEETIFVIIDSIKTQCDGLVAADKWGREMRAKNLTAMQNGEEGIKQTFTESRRALVANAVATAGQPQALAPAVPETDILAKIGVKE
jgi:uncharacterized protein YaaN involved in tellurite resistance